MRSHMRLAGLVLGNVCLLGFFTFMFLLAGRPQVRAESGARGYPDQYVAVGFQPDRQTASFKGPVAVADAVAVATLTSTTTGRIALLGKPNVTIGARFADTSQTCVVYLLLSYVDADGTETVKGRTAGKTCTGGTTTDAAGLFMAPDIYFTFNANELAGATHARLEMSTGPTTHAVTFWAGTN